LDLAPDNIAVVRARLEQQAIGCPVDAHVGSILDLPFADKSFDAAWVAQVLIYLSDTECQQALAELHRVVRPGGLVAAKESTGPLCPYPIDPRYWFPVYTHALMKHFPGAPRSCALEHWFERAGLEAVQQHGLRLLCRVWDSSEMTSLDRRGVALRDGHNRRLYTLALDCLPELRRARYGGRLNARLPGDRAADSAAVHGG
jgi:SAM-dependent methyltransferase